MLLQVDAACSAVLLSIFPSETSDPRTGRQCMQWYITWLEQQLKSLPESTLSLITGHNSCPRHRWSLELSNAFSEIAKCAKSSANSSIDDITESLLGQGLIEVKNTKDGFLEARSLVFAVIGWQTMLYRPALGTCPPQQLAVADEQDGYRGQAFMTLKQSQASAKRPLSEFLMGFGILLPPSHCCISTDPEEKQAFDDLRSIGPNGFNAFLLDSIGHFRIKWVDTISCHLEFDDRTNTVFLFRFPSFCATYLTTANPEKNTESIIFAAAASASSSRQWAVKEDICRLLRETLVSYRLLFGQEKYARKFFRTLEPFAGVPDIGRDHLLQSLCGRKSFHFTTNPLDKDDYDLRHDFPVFRSRISRLHKVFSAKKPRSWREIWRDKRDSAGWYTFWTVLVFGAASVLLSFCQVLLQIVALAQQ